MIDVILSASKDTIELLLCCIPFIVAGIFVKKYDEQINHSAHIYLSNTVFALMWLFIVFTIGVTCYSNEFLNYFDIKNLANTQYLHCDFANFFFNIVVAALSGDNHAIINLLGNIGLFVPIGFFGLWIMHDQKYLMLKITIRCLILSVLIEVAQWSAVRIADVTDVLLNTLGGFIGGALFCYIIALTNNYNGRYKRTRFIREKYIGIFLHFLVVISGIVFSVYMTNIVLIKG